MKGCIRLFICAVCGHRVIIQGGKRISELCDCLEERIAIQKEPRLTNASQVSGQLSKVQRSDQSRRGMSV